MVFGLNKKKVAPEESVDEFIEIDLDQDKSENKITVKTFTLSTYEDTGAVLDALRTGYNIVVMDVSPLKHKDVVELKRAISKVKKTVEALEGKIVGFTSSIVIATPSKVFDISKGDSVPEKPKSDVEYF